MLTLLVHQEVGDAHGRAHQHFARTAAGALFFDLADDRQGEVVVRAHKTGAVAGVARLGRRLDHAGTQTLARHFHQAKARDAAHLDARAVGLELVFHHLFDGGVVLALIHVDKVDDNQAREVTQTQLTRHFGGSLKVGLGRGLLDRTFLGGPTRVHVNRHQRFGHADHDIATRGQLHRGVEHAREVALDLIAGEKRQAFVVELHVFRVGGHDHFHEVFGNAVAALALDVDLVNLAVVEVTDRAFDQVAFFVDFRGRDGLQRQLADLLPEALEVFVIALDLGLGAFRAGSPDNQTSTLGHFDLSRDFFKFLTVSRIGDLARNAAATGGVGHQHAVATSKAEVGGQRRALVAALFFDNLHQQDLADLDDFLNLVAARARFAHEADVFAVIFVGDGFDGIVFRGGIAAFVVFAVGIVGLGVAGVSVIGRSHSRFIVLGNLGIGFAVLRLFDRRFRDPLHGRAALFAVEIDGFHTGDLIAVVVSDFCCDHGIIAVGLSRLAFRPAARPGASPLGLFVLVVLGRLRFGIGAFFLQQRLTVGHGNLVIIGVNFRESEEAMTVAAIIYKGRLKRRFNPCNLG